ncbi:ribbon-helix-helix domain-containing protein [Rhizobium sp. XQZ8]|uniref:ribbon-helix-helix domain-containing protein n=1 Tax=Rhizobium populisoli TaxID=2859785 RepID=UPI001C679604|nr:ribbon-helix-helix domain-containing protein [Rhizobium populisoli]MBW6420675.1 ribbon-helix-helix domain-containing protein [Rhizobium populisoli]
MGLHKIVIEVDDKLLAKIDRMAALWGLSRSEAVVRMLEEAFAAEDALNSKGLQDPDNGR